MLDRQLSHLRYEGLTNLVLEPGEWPLRGPVEVARVQTALVHNRLLDVTSRAIGFELKGTVSVPEEPVSYDGRALAWEAHRRPESKWVHQDMILLGAVVRASLSPHSAVFVSTEFGREQKPWRATLLADPCHEPLPVPSLDIGNSGDRIVPDALRAILLEPLAELQCGHGWELHHGRVSSVKPWLPWYTMKDQIPGQIRKVFGGGARHLPMIADPWVAKRGLGAQWVSRQLDPERAVAK